jgi:hypothetical protein
MSSQTERPTITEATGSPRSSIGIYLALLHGLSAQDRDQVTRLLAAPRPPPSAVRTPSRGGVDNLDSVIVGPA